MKIAFYEIEEWQVSYLKEKLSAYELAFYTGAFNEDVLPDAHVDIVSTFIDSRVTPKVLEQCPYIKYIATRTTGYDHINLEICKQKGVAASNVPTYGENTVAEFTFALLLSLSRKMYSAAKRVKDEGQFSFEGLQGFDLQGKTIGVVGTGHIGAYVVKIAHGFGMNVIAYDPRQNEQLAKDYNFSYVSFEQLLAQSDIITLHVPYMPATHHLINTTNLHLIKKGAILINTARGALVETDALVQGLKNGTFDGAGLDVLEEEGFVRDELDLLISGHPNESQLHTVLVDHELMHFDNVIITPHNAFNTIEAKTRILDTTIQNIEAFISGSPINLLTK